MWNRAILFVAGAALAALPCRTAVARQVSSDWTDASVPVWEVLYGGFRQLEDVAAAGAGEAWGVDAMDVGVGPGARAMTSMVQLRDGVWRSMQVIDDARLAAVAMSGPSVGFAVGDEGAIYRYDGHRWWPHASPTPLGLTDVALASPAEGWAVGERGALLRWDGRTWAVVDPPGLFPPFVGVACPAPGKAWAVSAIGEVFRFDGAWRLEPAPRLPRLSGLAFASARRGMVYGYGALEYADGAWTHAADPSLRIASLAWHGADAFGVIESRLVRYAEGEWTDVPGSPSLPYALDSLRFLRVAEAAHGVWGLAGDGPMVRLESGEALHAWPPVTRLAAIDVGPSGDGWSGGASYDSAFVGSRQGEWSRTQAGPTQSQVRDLVLTSDMDGWAVGESGGGPEPLEPRVWRYDGARWTDFPFWGKAWSFTHVDAVSGDDVWMNGTAIARWDGSTLREIWSNPVVEGTGALSMIAGGDDPEGWFGSHGQVYHLRGTTWITEALPYRGPARYLDMASGSDGWAASWSELAHYDGRTWIPVDVPLLEGDAIRGLSAPRQEELWVLLDPPALLRHAGPGWSRYSLAQFGGTVLPRRLRAFPFETPLPGTEVWLAGDNPSIARLRLVAPVTELFLPAIRLNAPR